MSKLLIDEPPLQVLPSLAIAIGLNEAIFLQQLHYWLKPDGKYEPHYREHEGVTRPWIYNTYHVKDTKNDNTTGWQANFPFWSIRTIKRIVTSLKRKGLIIVTDEFNDSSTNRTSWYTIDYKTLDALSTSGTLDSDKVALSEGDNLSLSREGQSGTLMTETTTETTSETPSADAENGAISKQPDKHNGLYQAEEVDETIAKFVSVTGFTTPTAKRQLKLWQVGVKEHLAEEQFSDQLPELYQCVWDNIEERVRAGELTITHPGAFTQYMYGIAQFKNKQNGPMSLDQLVSVGIVEVKTIKDKVGFFWPDGTLVGDITSELIEKHLYHNS